MRANAFVEIAFGDPTLVEAHLEKDGIDVVNTDGSNLLQTAIAFHKHDVCEMLIKKGIQVNHIDEDDQTPLHYAASHSALQVAESIINNGGIVECHNHLGNSPLWDAVHACDEEMIKLLLSSGADPNHKNINGHSPLDLAQTRGLVRIVAILNGCDNQDTS